MAATAGYAGNEAQSAGIGAGVSGAVRNGLIKFIDRLLAVFSKVPATPIPENPTDNDTSGAGDGGNNDDEEQERVLDLAKDVPDHCKGVFQCDKFTEQLGDRLEEAGIDYDVLDVESPTDWLYSDEHGVISQNGHHEGVQVGDTVYDNLNPQGVPRADWDADLGIGEGFGITVGVR